MVAAHTPYLAVAFDKAMGCELGNLHGNIATCPIVEKPSSLLFDGLDRNPWLPTP